MTSTDRQDIFRDGDYLVVRQRWVELPAECVVCGAVESKRLRLKIRASSKLFGLFGPGGAVVYFNAPTARLHAGVCERHGYRERRAKRILRALLWSSLACVLVPLGLVAWGVAELDSVALWLVMPILLLNVALMYEVARRQLLTAIHSDRHFVWLADVSPVVLNQFPQSEGEAGALSEIGS